MKIAYLFEQLDEHKVRCNLCAHRCTIADGGVGICQVRENQDGILYTQVYGQTIAQHVDPVEKKPLFHFFPNSLAYSIATPGCNFRCQWCQNADISQAPREDNLMPGIDASPEQIVAATKRNSCRSIAYTYTEPTIFFEYSYDTARMAHESGIFNIYVTNGFMTAEMLEMAQPYMDAANVDLKGFREEVYRKYVGARLQPVLDSMKLMKTLNIWLEVTSLIIPGVNDEEAELRDMAQFVADELGPEVPWHISRFFPTYKMTDVPATDVSILERAHEIGLESGLHHVYIGNVAGETNTTCHVCGHLLVQRRGYQVKVNDVAPGSKCPQCGTPVAGRGMTGSAE